MKKTLITISLMIAASITPTLTQAEGQSEATPQQVNTGFGLGAIIGGLLAGPPGAVLGAAGGGWLGKHDDDRVMTIAVLDTKLIQKNDQITRLETELSATKLEMAATIDQLQAAHSDQNVLLETLRNGLTTTVYFRTNEVTLPDQTQAQLNSLGELLINIPELHISMEGYADQRGDDEYNQHLSEERVNHVQDVLQQSGINPAKIQCHAYGESRAEAAEGDRENYIFDRRVTLHLSHSTL